MPRVTDVYAALPSMTGKFELEYEGELKGADQVARDLVRAAVGNVFDGYFGDADAKQIIEWFDLGGSLSLSDTTDAATLVKDASAVQGLVDLARTRRHRARRSGAGAWPRRSTSCSKGSIRRRRSAAATCAATTAPNRPVVRSRSSRARRSSRPMTTRTRTRAARRKKKGITTDSCREATLVGKDSEMLAGKLKPVGETDMKYKYSKYVPNLLDELDMDELMSKLSDLLMSSGFGNPRDTDDDSDRTMQALHDAILEALFNGGVLPDDLLEKLFGDAAEGNEEQARNQLEELIQQIIERMKESGYISTPPDLEPEKARRAMGGGGEGEPAEVKFEVTDKALDFLGYRALRDLLGSAGHSSAGRHDTRDLSTGIETSGAPKPYEFGDVMNLDVTATILECGEAADQAEAQAVGPISGSQASTSTIRI